MHFDNTLLSADDQTALAAAVAAIPALLTPLSAAITAAQTAAAPVVDLQSQIDTAKASFTGGMVPLSVNALCDRLNVAEAAAMAAAAALHTACQQCEPLVVQQILPIAQRQAVSMVKTANASFYVAGSNAANVAPLGTPFLAGLNAFLRSCFGPRENRVGAVLAKATRLQTLLTAIEGGSDFYSLA